jgi:hypothetical protein
LAHQSHAQARDRHLPPTICLWWVSLG